MTEHLNDPSWPRYPQTSLRFRGKHPFTVELWDSLFDEGRERIADIGVPVGVVTACNPYGRVASPSENRNADRRLARELKRRGLTAMRVIGMSPDGYHAEPGFAVARASADTMRELAERYEQTAFFWFDGELFWLVPTSKPESRIALPIDCPVTSISYHINSVELGYSGYYDFDNGWYRSDMPEDVVKEAAGVVERFTGAAIDALMKHYPQADVRTHLDEGSGVSVTPSFRGAEVQAFIDEHMNEWITRASFPPDHAERQPDQ